MAQLGFDAHQRVTVKGWVYAHLRTPETGEDSMPMVTVPRAQTPYMQYLEMLERVPEYRRPTVETLHEQAISYVWGWQDALRSAGVERDTGDSSDFGAAYGLYACYHELRGWSRISIERAFKAWRDGKRIPAEWVRL